jgi:CheY-like chemotaxis protein
VRILPDPDPEQSLAPAVPADDTNNILPGERVVLIVENDTNFSRFLLDVAHEHGFKGIIAGRGSAALSIAREIKPDAVTLDINLPDIDGWRVLDRLKDDVTTRDVPVQIITTEEERERGLRMGAMGALTKPLKTREALDAVFERIRLYTEPRVRRVLLVEPDDRLRAAIQDLVTADDVEVKATASATEALLEWHDAPWDLVITSSDLPDRRAFELVDALRELQGFGDTPIIIHIHRALSHREETYLRRLGQTMVVKDVRSIERLLDEAALFLHRPISTLPASQRAMIEQLHQTTAMLAGKKALLVDDDIRNIFAMTSLLEPHQMRIISAETGRRAIEMLQGHPDVDIVLMDIMMPDMDGYDTMRAIRKLATFRALPIIALTAKAMKGDREKCIEAGASDYISKPVDIDQLMAMLKVWLHR